jgi:uncharacterized protein YdaU (DUF1376 family)
MLLIGALWNNGGRLDASDETLAAYAKLSAEEWKAVKPKLLMPNMLKVVRGKLTQARVTEDLAKYRDTSGKRSEAGKAGGLASAGKAKENRQANASRLPTKPEPEPEPKNIVVGAVDAGANDTDDWPPGKATDHAALLAKINLHLDPSKRQGLVTSVGEIARWRQLGCSWDLDVVPTVTAHASRPGSLPVHTWAYFAPAVARSHADRNRPPEAIGLETRHERPSHPTGKFDRHKSNLERAVAGSEIAARLRTIEPESSF